MRHWHLILRSGRKTEGDFVMENKLARPPAGVIIPVAGGPRRIYRRTVIRGAIGYYQREAA